jgi:hypothetical protein
MLRFNSRSDGEPRDDGTPIAATCLSAATKKNEPTAEPAATEPAAATARP